LSNLLWLALPGVVLATHLVAAYFRYTRSEAQESLRERYVTFLRSKGADSRRVARHVFREAAVPLVTLFVTELIGVLLVTVFVVEVVFEVPGVGRLAYLALERRDIELVMVLTVLFALVGIVANVVQDVAADTLDARID
jgi:ABC-type dipeptide/oligopeptide/nickel transport systems, permease components